MKCNTLGCTGCAPPLKTLCYCQAARRSYAWICLLWWWWKIACYANAAAPPAATTLTQIYARANKVALPFVDALNACKPAIERARATTNRAPPPSSSMKFFVISRRSSPLLTSLDFYFVLYSITYSFNYLVSSLPAVIANGSICLYCACIKYYFQ